MLEKSLLDGNKYYTITTKGEQYKYFSSNNFKVCQLQINQQDEGWLCGYQTLLARQNFVKLLSKKLKFNKELFRIHNRTVIINKMKDREVSKIRNTLFHILTFLAQKITSKTPVPDRLALCNFNQ